MFGCCCVINFSFLAIRWDSQSVCQSPEVKPTFIHCFLFVLFLNSPACLVYRGDWNVKLHFTFIWFFVFTLLKASGKSWYFFFFCTSRFIFWFLAMICSAVKVCQWKCWHWRKCSFNLMEVFTLSYTHVAHSPKII